MKNKNDRTPPEKDGKAEKSKAGEEKDVRDQKEQSGKKQKKKRDKTVVAVWVLAGVLALGLVVFGVVMGVRAIYNAYLDSGAKYRNDVILESDHFKVNALMLSYRYYDNIYSGVYGDPYTDPEVLKNTESAQAGATMFEYYEQQQILLLMRTLRYAEKAAESGVTLDSEDLSIISNRLRAIENAARNRDITTEQYLFAFYGRGMKLSDAEDLFRLERMAEKQISAFESTVKIGDAEIDAYLTAGILRRYDRMDYYVVDFGNDIEADDADDIRTAKEAQARYRAEQLGSLGSGATVETFVAMAKELLRQEAETMSADPDALVGEWLSTDAFAGKQLQEVSEGDPDVSVWLWNYDRRDGDILVDEDTVYYVARAPYSIDTRVDAYLVIDVIKDHYESSSAALDALNRVEALYGKSEQTEEAFRQLAAEYAENQVLAGREGYFDDTGFDEGTGEALSSALAKYLYDWKKSNAGEGGAPAVGATGKIYGETELYYVYYLGEGALRSRVDAREYLIDQACRNYYNSLAEEDKVTMNRKSGARSAELYAKK